MRLPQRRVGFTLIELLVVIAVIGLLVAILLPAINSVRSAAQRAQCQSNLKQIGTALINYTHSNGVLPPANVINFNRADPSKPIFQGWSAQAKLLPYLEGDAQYDMFNFDVAYDAKGPDGVSINGTAAQIIVSVFICPSDVKSSRHRTGEGTHNINYGINRGDWYIWGGFAKSDNPTSPDWKEIPAPNAPFYVNSSVEFNDFRDGVSKTVLMAEVKARLDYVRDAPGIAYRPTDPNTPQPDPMIDPALVPHYLGHSGSVKADSEHSEWHDGGAHQTGFTTAWPPNKITGGKASGGAVFRDMDIIGIRERNGGPTFGAITARSYHQGGVHALMGDGAVQFIGNGIDGHLWRALGSHDGGELITNTGESSG